MRRYRKYSNFDTDAFLGPRASADTLPQGFHIDSELNHRLALHNVDSYELCLTQRAGELVGQLQQAREAKQREQLLRETAFELTEANDLLCPTVYVFDESMPLSDKDERGQASAVKWVQGEYEFPDAMIYISNLEPHGHQPVSFESILDTFCHEFAHHLDYFLWGDSEHNEMFYSRVNHLVAALVAEARKCVTCDRNRPTDKTTLVGKAA